MLLRVAACAAYLHARHSRRSQVRLYRRDLTASASCESGVTCCWAVCLRSWSDDVDGPCDAAGYHFRNLVVAVYADHVFRFLLDGGVLVRVYGRILFTKKKQQT